MCTIDRDLPLPVILIRLLFIFLKSVFVDISMVRAHELINDRCLAHLPPSEEQDSVRFVMFVNVVMSSLIISVNSDLNSATGGTATLLLDIMITVSFLSSSK